jgi:hypothetical protein
MGSTKKNPRPTSGPVNHGLSDSHCPQSASHDELFVSCLPSAPTSCPPSATSRRFSIISLVCICILVVFGWIGVPGEGPVAPNGYTTQYINQKTSLFQVNILLFFWTVSHLATFIRIDPLHWACSPRMM